MLAIPPHTAPCHRQGLPCDGAAMLFLLAVFCFWAAGVRARKFPLSHIPWCALAFAACVIFDGHRAPQLTSRRRSLGSRPDASRLQVRAPCFNWPDRRMRRLGVASVACRDGWHLGLIVARLPAGPGRCAVHVENAYGFGSGWVVAMARRPVGHRGLPSLVSHPCPGGVRLGNLPVASHRHVVRAQQRF